MASIHFWSFSSLMNYERCPYSVSPERWPYDPSKANAPRPEAAQRGIDAHSEIEKYLIRQEDYESPYPNLPFDELTKKHPQCELKLGVDNYWKPHDYKGAWLKIICDAVLINNEEKRLTIYDWKTGKRDYNEVKHTQQLILYMCVASMNYPLIQSFTSELWYIDHDKIITNKTYTKDQLTPIAMRWDTRGKKMTTDETFIAKPSKSNCRFCDHKEECEFAYELS